MKIPVIKISSVLKYSKNSEVCVFNLVNTTRPIEVVWGSSIFHIRHYDLRGFISRLEAEGYRLIEKPIFLNIESGGKLKKQIQYKSLNVIYDEENQIDLDNERLENILNFFEIHSILDVLGYGDIIQKLEYLQFSLQDITNAKSNNYSLYEELINLIIPHNLNSYDFKNDFVFQDTLCVISVFNANDTIFQVLYALDNQDIETDFYNHFEICIVDDNSDHDVIESIKAYKFNQLKDIKFIKNYSNLNQGKVVNQAFVNSNITQKILLSLDADIVVETNYLKNHLIRQNLYQNISTGSCRENSDKNELKNVEDLKKVYKNLKPDYTKDSRFYKKYDEKLVGGIDESFESRSFEESNYYRELGNGNRIKGNIDLQMLYKGHNFMMSVDSFRSANYAGKFYYGWGDEDGYIGRKIFAAGTFIVPVISSSVFHINHSPRSFNSLESRDEALKKNVERRNLLLRNEDSYFHIN